MVNTAPGRSHSTPQRQCGHLSRILLYPDWPARTGRYSQALPVDSDLSRRDAIPDDASSPGALSKNTNVVARPKYSCARTGRQRAGRYSQALSINTDISRRHAFPYYTFSPGALANDAGSRAITVAFHTSHITYAIDTGARARRRQCGGKLAFARPALPIYADLVTPSDTRLAGAKRSLTITERCSGMNTSCNISDLPPEPRRPSTCQSSTISTSASGTAKVARGLDVRYVVEGSIRRAGNRVRITSQLIDAGTGHHLWADRYELIQAQPPLPRLLNGLRYFGPGKFSLGVGRSAVDRIGRQPNDLGLWF